MRSTYFAAIPVLALLLVVAGCSGGDQAETAGDHQTTSAETTPDSGHPPAAEPVETPAEEPSVKAEEPSPEADDPETPEPAGTAEVPEVAAAETEDPQPAPVEEPEVAEVGDPSGETETVVPDEVETPPTEVPVDDPAGVASPEPEGPVMVADTKPGLTRIGAVKCRMCHKVQYESWAATAHAGLEPALDCESCHGSGSEYRKKSVMEDPELAKAAGLVMPDAGFCVRCHETGWKDEMLARAHAHKDGG